MPQDLPIFRITLRIFSRPLPFHEFFLPLPNYMILAKVILINIQFFQKKSFWSSPKNMCEYAAGFTHFPHNCEFFPALCCFFIFFDRSLAEAVQVIALSSGNSVCRLSKFWCISSLFSFKQV